MGDTLQSLILVKNPTLIFGVSEFLLAVLSLSPTPTFVPLVLLLTILRVHGMRISCRSTRVLELMCSWVAVTAGASLAHYSSATNALSSSLQSFAAVAVMSAATYVLAILPFYVDIRFRHKFQTVWAQVAFLPVVWAMTWAIVSHLSPVGRLLNWSPVSSSHPFGWLLPYTGPMGIDWAVGACAALSSEVAAAWLMSTDNDEQLVHLSTSSGEAQSNRRSRSLLTLGTLLVALTLPSLYVGLPARTDTIFDTSPLGVACALPPVRKGQRPTLGDFITETKKLTSQAKVVLWPESAVEFEGQEEREAAFEELRKNIQRSVIGVAFDEFVPKDPSNPGGSHMRRNGLALVHEGQKKGEEVVQYYKRNLVPFTESFSAIPSTEPPAMYNFELGPPKWATKSEWSSTPNHTRPVTITSSICLDFAFSSAFSSLDSRPALILAPARTWDSTVSLAMWEQAKSRANEIGSMVLWCDGGAMGVSGVGGGGISEIMQLGSGSWTRTIGLQFPFDQRRTVYAVVGDFGVLVLLVAIMGGSSVVWHLPALSGSLSGSRSVLQAVPLLRRLLPGRQRDQESLIDVAVPGERQSLLH
ncbi:uncharacterized protein BJ212DRAFT_1422212 [Suillus subaureus]|uniref:CN hydrolase domain-containing protein n=1 Tax=Suillus subaureus TaxID=48587 RepID=A0A9P7EM06_9AGAM|nr:uncharacterized protein BJ212DRAFT_1422212 [Suillus subaureus]KAG1825722.1 hypothetical protein BJ212DRAFT_1422212 [Suillus subaureus]